MRKRYLSAVLFILIIPTVLYSREFLNSVVHLNFGGMYTFATTGDIIDSENNVIESKIPTNTNISHYETAYCVTDPGGRGEAALGDAGLCRRRDPDRAPRQPGGALDGARLRLRHGRDHHALRLLSRLRLSPAGPSGARLRGQRNPLPDHHSQQLLAVDDRYLMQVGRFHLGHNVGEGHFRIYGLEVLLHQVAAKTAQVCFLCFLFLLL